MTVLCMCRLPQRAQIIAILVEGMSMRAIVRSTDLAQVVKEYASLGDEDDECGYSPAACA